MPNHGFDPYLALVSPQYSPGYSAFFYRTIRPTYLGIAFNSVLPGSVGGDLFRLYYVLKKFPSQKSAAILSIFVDRLNGLMGILFIACIVSPYYLETFRHNERLFYLMLTCMSIFIGGIFLFVIFVFLLSEKVGIAVWLENKCSQSRWSHSLMPILDAIHTYRNAKLILFESLLISVSTQILLVVVTVIITNMMDLPMLSLFDFMVALVIGQVANLVPLTPGGIGVGEAAFANIILLLNPASTAPYATVFLALRVLSTMAYLPGVFLGVHGFHLLSQQSIDSLPKETVSQD